MFSWIIESRGIQVWSFCSRVLCASGVQLDVEANRLVGASSGCRYAFKAILSTSFFCGYGLAFILCRLCFVIWNGCFFTKNPSQALSGKRKNKTFLLNISYAPPTQNSTLRFNPTYDDLSHHLTTQWPATV